MFGLNTSKQLNKLADICSEVGTLALGSVVLPEVLANGQRRPSIELAGLFIAFGFWGLSLWIINKMD